uniref:AB hydrolase-1 domain-containing protein n=1 Tax=Oryza meridionalis TaxID=40149 RepID=A0A0E0EZI1_9ORYZ
MADQIEHLHLPIRGLNLHIAQVGKGEISLYELGTVMFLHGFPEIWYSWRHQMLAAAAAGYRAVAPDWRGYGLSGQPPEQEEATWDDLVADVLAILDALAVPGAFLVGKDFGAMPAYDFALRHPACTRGVACLGVPFSPAPASFDAMPEGFYVLRWREAGRAEADFGRHDVRRVVRTIYILFSGADIPVAKEGQEIMDLADASTPLPPWLTEADLDVYASLYENSGFRFPLQMPYRAVHRRPSRKDARFEVPVLMVIGEKDYAFKFPGFEAAVRGGAMERFAPELKIEFLPEGSHFAQEQLPEQVNRLLLGFFAEHPTPVSPRSRVARAATLAAANSPPSPPQPRRRPSSRRQSRAAARTAAAGPSSSSSSHHDPTSGASSGRGLRTATMVLGTFDGEGGRGAGTAVAGSGAPADGSGRAAADAASVRGRAAADAASARGRATVEAASGRGRAAAEAASTRGRATAEAAVARRHGDDGRLRQRGVTASRRRRSAAAPWPDLAARCRSRRLLAFLSRAAGRQGGVAALHGSGGSSARRRSGVTLASSDEVAGSEPLLGLELFCRWRPGGSWTAMYGCGVGEVQYSSGFASPTSHSHHRHVAPLLSALLRRGASSSRPEAMATAEQRQIEHVHLPVRGLTLHVAQAGKGLPCARAPRRRRRRRRSSGELGTVVFLHGFPEIWYSWRHQMLAVAAAGYCAVAPDWRGYGLSDQPPEPEAAAYDDLIEDLLAILDALAVPKAFLVGKDFGAMPAYDFALRHPNRTCGVMCLGIPLGTAGLSFDTLPEGFYILRWAQPGRAEADFGKYDVKRVVRTIYILFSRSEIPIAKENQEIMDLADLSTPLPEWFSEEDLDVYSSLYENSGFRYPLQMPYRSLHQRKPIGDAKFQVPVFIVMGEKDYVFKFPGIESAMKDGTMEKHAPNIKITYIPEGGHFVQEQFPDYVNELLLGFLKDHPVAI